MTWSSHDLPKIVTTGVSAATSSRRFGSSPGVFDAMAGRPEGGQLRALPAHRARGREELDVLGVRARPAALDERHPELVEHPRDAQLVGERERDVLALRAVAQRGVVEDDRRRPAHAGTLGRGAGRALDDGGRERRRPDDDEPVVAGHRGSARSAVRQPSSRARATAASIAVGGVGAPERPAQQHRRREDRADRVGHVLAGDVRAQSRGSARTGRTCRARSGARRATPTAASRASPRARPPRRTGCRRTGSR